MVQARSIGQRAANIVIGPPTQGRVLAGFGRVWDLVTDAGEVLAVAWDGVPDGPFNILLDHKPGSALPAGTRFVVSDHCIRFAGPAAPIELAGASCWDAHPAWIALAANYHRIRDNLPTLASVLAAEAPKGSMADLCNTTLPGISELDLRLAACGHISRVSPASANYLARATGAISAILAAFAACDGAALPATLPAAVAGLCGLGPGLTPAGDDWLAGWLLALHLTESALGLAFDVPGSPVLAYSTANQYSSRLALARASVRSALSSTTVLSGAFLKCACQGEADANWHALLRALAYGVAEEVKLAARTILAYGATSGADMLAGFLNGQPGRPKEKMNQPKRVTTNHNQEG
jgi:hypothetical protein